MDISAARWLLERGVVAAPQSGYLRLYYGYGLLWQGRYPEAIHQFEVYSRINPEEANPWDSMGEAYLIAGIPDRALEKYAGDAVLTGDRGPLYSHAYVTLMSRGQVAHGHRQLHVARTEVARV